VTISLKNKKIGLALGGGGVRGLAHLPILRTLDELQIPVHHIIGTSMGAIVGALYASNLTAADIEHRLKQHILLEQDNVKSAFKKSKHLLKWVKAIGPETTRGGVLAVDGLFEHLFHELQGLNFSDLSTPFEAMACDFYSAQAELLNTGPLLPAVLASMAVPGVFAPQVIDGRTLVDGGLVNNLPYDQLPADVDYRIAVQLTSPPARRKDGKQPASYDVATNTVDIMELHMTRKKIDQNPPELLVSPMLEGIGVFDFHKIEDVLQRGEDAAAIMRASLKALLWILEFFYLITYSDILNSIAEFCEF